MATVTGKYRMAKVNTQLGPDVLLLQRMAGREELGRMFEYNLDLVSVRGNVKPEDILGTNLTVAIESPNDSALRYINGFVTQFSEMGSVQTPAFGASIAYKYRAVVNPWIWFATRRSDCRIFNDKTVPEIVGDVLGIYGGQIDRRLTRTYTKGIYCVQYRETDFNFVSRLLEQEGIFYYFKHANGSHELVLADSVSAHEPSPLCARIKFHTGGDKRVVVEEDYINEWTATTKVQSGKYLLKDYDFVRARTVEGAAANPRSHGFGDLEIYDYPSEGVDVAAASTNRYASSRMEELQAQYRIFSASGNVRGLEVGYRFTLADHPQRVYNAEYVNIAATIRVSVGDIDSGGGDTGFHISFTAIKSDQVYRVPRMTPKPVIQGAQTAFVVGNGEIDPDKHGRVKVQFHWDRKGGTCWVRVAQIIAGKSWGAMFIPRVGQEVVVEFLEGDPDRPIITGVVYNGVATTPYALPGEKTKSTIKTNSSEGGGGFNEIRLEDKKGSEQIFIHGEKQMDLRVKKDRLEFIGQDDHLVVKNDRKERVEKNDNLQVKGDLNEKVTGIASLKVDQNLQYKVGMKTALDSGQEIHLKAGMNIILEASAQISLKVGGSFIDIGPAGVFIKGPMVFINSGGSAGSGSGASPAAPADPKDADDATAGSKDDAPPKPQPPTPKTYSPQAVMLQNAAKSGAPFCAI